MNGADDFKMESGGRLSYFKLEKILPKGNIFQGTEYVLDSHYSLIDSFTCGNGYLTDDHDFRMLPNGHVLLVSYDVRDTDMRAVTGDQGASKKASVVGGIIQELDQNKDVVFQWRRGIIYKLPIWHISILPIRIIRLIDYAHLNSVEVDNDGNLLASFRAMDNVVKINRTATGNNLGKVIWRWGGMNSSINYFTFIGDTLSFSAQHDIRRLANGTLVCSIMEISEKRCGRRKLSRYLLFACDRV